MNLYYLSTLPAWNIFLKTNVYEPISNFSSVLGFISFFIYIILIPCCLWVWVIYLYARIFKKEITELSRTETLIPWLIGLVLIDYLFWGGTLFFSYS